jgi:hypothetical protein
MLVLLWQDLQEGIQRTKCERYIRNIVSKNYLNVNTLGYATQLIKFSLMQAIKMNAKYCFLESSNSGLGIYEKLGFKSLFENTTYIYGPEKNIRNL